MLFTDIQQSGLEHETSESSAVQNVSDCILDGDWRPEERTNGFISARSTRILQEVQTQSGRTKNIKHRLTKGIKTHCSIVSL